MTKPQLVKVEALFYVLQRLLSAKLYESLKKIGLIPFAGVSPKWLFWCRQTNL